MITLWIKRLICKLQGPAVTPKEYELERLQHSLCWIIDIIRKARTKSHISDESILEEVEFYLIKSLYHSGIYTVCNGKGDKIDPERHKVLAYRETENPDMDGRIAVSCNIGFWGEHVKKPQEVIAFRYQKRT